MLLAVAGIFDWTLLVLLSCTFDRAYIRTAQSALTFTSSSNHLLLSILHDLMEPRVRLIFEKLLPKFSHVTTWVNSIPNLLLLFPVKGTLLLVLLLRELLEQELFVGHSFLIHSLCKSPQHELKIMSLRVIFSLCIRRLTSLWEIYGPSEPVSRENKSIPKPDTLSRAEQQIPERVLFLDAQVVPPYFDKHTIDHV